MGGQVRIAGGPHVRDLQITDAATGTPIPYVLRVDVEPIDARDQTQVRARITHGVALDVIVEATKSVVANAGAVRARAEILGLDAATCTALGDAWRLIGAELSMAEKKAAQAEA